MTRRLLAALAAFLFIPTLAYATDNACPELSTLQVVAGYVTLMGIAKVAGIVMVTGGILMAVGGFLRKIWAKLWAAIRHIADIIAYLVSFALIAAGSFAGTDHQLLLVLGGSICFGASVLFTLTLREAQLDLNDLETITSGTLTVVWGAVAVFYGSTAVGFLAVLALMGLLGFSVIVSPLCYSFGFRKESAIASGTAAALLLVAFYIANVLSPAKLPALFDVFKWGVFWAGSFVGFSGLLILSNKWYVKHAQASYSWIQFVTMLCYGIGLIAGILLGINSLAGMAGTFFVFYIAAKLIEIEAGSLTGYGVIVALAGGFLYTVWLYGHDNAPVLKYLTTALPS